MTHVITMCVLNGVSKQAIFKMFHLIVYLYRNLLFLFLVVECKKCQKYGAYVPLKR